MRRVKVALAEALRTDAAVSELVPDAQIFATERAVLPVLPSVEVIGLSSERAGDGPMVRHELSIEVTVSHASEDGADELLDAAVRAVRQRLDAAEHQLPLIALATREVCLVVLAGTRWSVSASAASGVVRGAAISLSVEVSE